MKVSPLGGAAEPMQFGDTAVVAASRFVVKQDATAVYVVGLAPSQAYDVEPDAQELFEARTDPGGILELKFPNGFSGGIRIRRVAPPSPKT